MKQQYFIDFRPLSGFSLLLFVGMQCVSSIPLTNKQFDELEGQGVPRL